jgi:uncharacterized membrane protein
MLSALTSTVIGKFFLTMLVAMAPIVELRGAIPIGVGYGLDLPVAFLAALIGNMIPVPFLIIFGGKVFEFLKKHSKLLGGFIRKVEKKAESKIDAVNKYKWLGLFVFVAIPLPGTGAWTGAAIAIVMEMKLRRAFPPILLGVLVAGLIISAITFTAKAALGG